MKLLLAQPIGSGQIGIGWTSDGRYHIVWHDQRLGSSPSLEAAIAKARSGPLKTASDGTDIQALGISSQREDWFLPCGTGVTNFAAL